MKKLLLSVGLFSLLLLPGSAGAAFDNVVVTIPEVEPGDAISADIDVELTSGWDLESISFDIAGDGLPASCLNVANTNGNGTTTRSLSLGNATTTEGTYQVTFVLYGFSSNAFANNNCFPLFADTETVTEDLVVKNPPPPPPPVVVTPPSSSSSRGGFSGYMKPHYYMNDVERLTDREFSDAEVKFYTENWGTKSVRNALIQIWRNAVFADDR